MLWCAIGAAGSPSSQHESSASRRSCSTSKKARFVDSRSRADKTIATTGARFAGLGSRAIARLPACCWPRRAAAVDRRRFDVGGGFRWPVARGGGARDDRNPTLESAEPGSPTEGLATGSTSTGAGPRPSGVCPARGDKAIKIRRTRKTRLLTVRRARWVHFPLLLERTTRVWPKTSDRVVRLRRCAETTSKQVDLR